MATQLKVQRKRGSRNLPTALRANREAIVFVMVKRNVRRSFNEVFLNRGAANAY